ncbi:MAG: hypothetical protein JSU63_13255 [Phycisphaerales bacterium]|nr:MAG: hypothetical protein JSU63_13255 [Phycisphaerales bacterium]
MRNRRLGESRRVFDTAAVVLLGICIIGWAGCRTLSNWRLIGWSADYDSAERRVLETGRDMLIWYTDPLPGKSDPLDEVLHEPAVKDLTKPYVRCKLSRSYEPDRRYVAQFGVERAPALIVVHTDGTYHALTGMMSVETVRRGLTKAVAPGDVPTFNHLIPRQAEYHWHSNIEVAREASASSGRPILVVYYRSLSRDWPRLERLLTRREVYRRLAEMVHCRINTLRPWSKAQITEFGALKLPALVITRNDGSYETLEMPTSYETIVRFADRFRQTEATANARAGADSEHP